MARFLIDEGLAGPKEGTEGAGHGNGPGGNGVDWKELEWKPLFMKGLDRFAPTLQLTREDRFHYWQFMAVFFNLIGDREKVRESREKMSEYAP